MKQVIKNISLALLIATVAAPVALMAQKEEKDKDSKDKKEAEQIVITRKSDNDAKVTIEINGDKVTVNGKPIEDGKDGDVMVRRHKIKDVRAYGGSYGDGVTSWNGGDAGNFYKLFNVDENKAMLGVTTEKDESGAEVQDVSKESAAEKAGLKKGDIITRIDDKKIEEPDDLSEAIGSHKPGDKVTVTFLRDKKDQKVTAELTKWKGMNAFTYVPGQNFNLNVPNIDYNQIMPKLKAMPNMNWNRSGGGPKLGLSVQDTEDGKGVKVLDVDEDGNGAKAGIKEDDVITEVDGKAVNSADEVAKIMRDSKDKGSVKMKLLRNGKSENVEVKIPKKLKSADL